jgi:hypothetical protein
MLHSFNPDLRDCLTEISNSQQGIREGAGLNSWFKEKWLLETI